MIATSSRNRTLGVVVGLAALCAPPAWGQANAYHILVTNDDGLDSPGLQVLAEKLRGVGTVHVVAPCGERSGSSMAVGLRAELRLEPRPKADGTMEYCVDTTPASAVMLAIDALSPEGGFDLVVSGINAGANVGTVSHMSGTIGAAMMGAFYGIPAVAASFGARSADYDYAARFVAGFVTKLRQQPPIPGVVFSINIPMATEAETKGVVVAKMGGMHLRIGYEEQQGAADGRRFRPRIGLATEGPSGSDTEAFLHGMITITPLQFDWTAYQMLDQLKSWRLTPTPLR